jgi:hypothetical protein
MRQEGAGDNKSFHADRFAAFELVVRGAGDTVTFFA